MDADRRERQALDIGAALGTVVTIAVLGGGLLWFVNSVADLPRSIVDPALWTLLVVAAGVALLRLAGRASRRH